MPRKRIPYDAVIRAALERALQAFDPLEPEVAEERCAELEGASPVERRALLRRRGDFGRVEVVAGLCRRAYSLRHSQPAEALRIARLATQAAGALSRKRALRALAADLRSEAWAQVANSLRVQGDLGAADRTWRRADAYLKQGSQDPQLRSLELELKGVLRTEERRFHEAVSVLAEAASLYEAAGLRHEAGRSRLILARALFNRGEVEEALHAAFQGSGQIEPERERGMGIGAFHNLILYAAELGHTTRALLLLSVSLHHYERIGGLFHLRGLWLAARISASRGRPTAAPLLEKIKAELLRRRLYYDAALCSLDLALAYAHGGHFGKVKELAAEMYPVFVRQEIPREASATLLLFAQAAREEQATAEAIARWSQEVRTFKRTLPPVPKSRRRRGRRQSTPPLSG